MGSVTTPAAYFRPPPQRKSKMVFHFNYTSRNEWGRPSCAESIKSKRGLMSFRENLFGQIHDDYTRGYGSPMQGTITEITQGACKPYYEKEWGETSGEVRNVTGKYNNKPKEIMNYGAKCY